MSFITDENLRAPRIVPAPRGASIYIPTDDTVHTRYAAFQLASNAYYSAELDPAYTGPGIGVLLTSAISEAKLWGRPNTTGREVQHFRFPDRTIATSASVLSQTGRDRGANMPYGYAFMLPLRTHTDDENPESFRVNARGEVYELMTEEPEWVLMNSVGNRVEPPAQRRVIPHRAPR